MKKTGNAKSTRLDKILFPLALAVMGASGLAQAADFWADNFTGTAGAADSSWFDNTGTVRYAAASGAADLKVTATRAPFAGTVNSISFVSPNLLDITEYPYVDVAVGKFYNGAAAVRIYMKQNGGKGNTQLLGSVSSAGISTFDISQYASNFPADVPIYFALQVSGSQAGSYIALSSFRIYNADAVPTPTPTINYMPMFMRH